MTNQGIAILFSPFSLGSLRLRDRTVMSPMIRWFAPNGILPDEAASTGLMRFRAIPWR